jgi:hypothetical protein
MPFACALDIHATRVEFGRPKLRARWRRSDKRQGKLCIAERDNSRLDVAATTDASALLIQLGDTQLSLPLVASPPAPGETSDSLLCP